MRIRIGIADTPREVEMETDDAQTFIANLEAAHAAGEGFIWVDAIDGKQVGIPLSRLGFIEIESDQKVSVGFRT